MTCYVPMAVPDGAPVSQLSMHKADAGLTEDGFVSNPLYVSRLACHLRRSTAR